VTTHCWKHMILTINGKCPACERGRGVWWEIEHHDQSGRACPRPSREDAHAVRTMLKRALGYVPKILWSRR
jgi:hypothetical protein